jgi:hypothetical protein
MYLAVHTGKWYASSWRVALTSEPLFVVLGYVAVFLLAFLPVIVTPFGFYDSYAVLDSSDTGTMWRNVYPSVAGGRPLFAILLTLAMHPLSTIGDLRYLRFDGVLGIALIAWTVYILLRRGGVTRWLAILLPIFVCTLPPFPVYAAGADCAIFPYAMLLSIASYYLLVAAARRYNERLAAAGLVVAAITLQTASMMIYQPAAMAIIAFMAGHLMLYGPKQPMRRHVTLAALVVLAVGVSLGMDFVASKTLPSLLYPREAAISRNSLVSAPLQKAGWFFSTALPRTFDLYLLSHDHRLIAAMAAVVATLFAGGIWLISRDPTHPRDIKLRLLRTLCAVACLPLAYLPNLLVNEDWSSFRTLTGMEMIVTLGIGGGLISLSQVKDVRWTRLAASGALILALAGVGLAAYTVNAEFAVSEMAELNFATQQLVAQDRPGATEVIFFQPKISDTTAPIAISDEFGVSSTAESWVPAPLVHLVLSERHSANRDLPVVLVPPGQSMQVPLTAIVVDMRDFPTKIATQNS